MWNKFQSLNKIHKVLLIYIAIFSFIVLGLIFGNFLINKNEINKQINSKSQKNTLSSNEPSPSGKNEEGLKEKNNSILVYVSGAVLKPGVYEFSEGARIIDALNKATLGENSNEEVLNLAQYLKDEDKIFVPTKILAQDGSFNNSSEPSQDIVGANQGYKGGSLSSNKKLSLNSCSPGELESVPGIGPVTSNKIIQYRDKNGGFSSLEELKEVSGIGDKTYEKLLEYLSL